MKFINYFKDNDAANFLFSFLVLMSFILLMPTNGAGSSGIMLALVLSFFLYPKISKAWFFQNKYILLFVLVYLCFLVSYSFNYKQALHTSWGVLRGMCCSLLAIILLKEISESILHSAIRAVIVCSVLLLSMVLVYNIYQYGILGMISRQWLDTMVHRNRLGVGIAVGFVFTLAAFLSSDFKNNKHNGLFLMAMAFLCGMAFINHSRGATLAMIAAGCVMLLYWHWLKALLILILVGVVSWLGSHFANVITHANGSIGNGREFLWPPIFERVKQDPIWGYGLHAVNNDPVLQAQNIEKVGHVHSIYLDIIYSSGIVGVCFWLCILIICIRKNTPLLGYENKGLLKYLGLGIFVYILVHGLVDFAFYSMAIMMYLSFSLVLILNMFVKGNVHENTSHC